MTFRQRGTSFERPAGVDADIGAGPIVVRHCKRRRRLKWQLRRRRRRCYHRGKRYAGKKAILHDGRPKQAVGV